MINWIWSIWQWQSMHVQLVNGRFIQTQILIGRGLTNREEKLSFIVPKCD